MGELFLLSVLWFIAWGLVGLALAPRFGAPLAFSFIISGLFGPFGLIIIALYNRNNDTSLTEEVAKDSDWFDGEPNLGDDDYRIYLSERYGLKKNDILSQFQVNRSLFATLDQALSYSDNVYREELETDRENFLLEEIQREAEREREDEKRREAAENRHANRFKRRAFGATILATAILLLGLLYHRERLEQATLEDAKEQNFADLRKNLQKFGLDLNSSAWNVDFRFENNPKKFSPGVCSGRSLRVSSRPALSNEMLDLNNWNKVRPRDGEVFDMGTLYKPADGVELEDFLYISSSRLSMNICFSNEDLYNAALVERFGPTLFTIDGHEISEDVNIGSSQTEKTTSFEIVSSDVINNVYSYDGDCDGHGELEFDSQNWYSNFWRTDRASLAGDWNMTGKMLTLVPSPIEGDGRSNLMGEIRKTREGFSMLTSARTIEWRLCEYDV